MSLCANWKERKGSTKNYFRQFALINNKHQLAKGQKELNCDFTDGNITKKLLKFAFPLMVGNLLQQLYNIADTLIVGRYLGENALAAVGSSYTLMIFLTSILSGLCMGSSAYFSMQFGKKDDERLKKGIFMSFIVIGIISLIINIASFLGIDGIIWFMRVKGSLVKDLMREYLLCILSGITAVFLYNYFSNLLRAVGNSVVPLIFLGVSSVLNILLDLLFVVIFEWGVSGAAVATVISQYVSGAGIGVYYAIRCTGLHIRKVHMRWESSILREITGLSVLTCLQQSVMNFGILMVQGLVNSFGTVVMAAFAAAVKIDSFAYSPVQDFGNAFSTYVAQNYGAGRIDRIKEGMKKSVFLVFVFCTAISVAVCTFGSRFMELFVDGSNTDIIAVGAQYLRIEGAAYFGIGLLFIFYGYFRAVGKPFVSVVLTVISLGTRVVLAYVLASFLGVGVVGIWVSVPIGWVLADIGGVIFMKRYSKVYKS